MRPDPRHRAALLAGLLIAASASHGAGDPSVRTDAVHEALVAARDAKRGATLMVDGASIAMLITAIDNGHVSGRNQQFERIVVRLDAIDAVQF